MIRGARMGPTVPTRSWWMSDRAALSLDRPPIMFILNVTPDSFADGGRFPTPECAADAVLRAVREGATAVDVGGESTRPGSARVDATEQIRRVVPVIRAIRSLPGHAGAIPISIDTTRAEVAAGALDAGADAINDVSAGTEDPDLLRLAARRATGVVLMHRTAPPEKDSYSDRYESPPLSGDVVGAVREFLGERIEAALRAGVRADSIVIDPGLGFGKSVVQNLELIARTPELTAMGFPVLSALSRKSFVGRASLGRDSSPDERLYGTLALSVAHLLAGATIFRVHDVAPHAAALAAARELAGLSRAGTLAGHEPTMYTPGASAPNAQATARSGDRPILEDLMASDLVKQFTEANFEAEVLSSPVPVLVDFWAEWCQPCRMLAPVVEAVAQQMGAAAKVGKVDTDSNREIAGRYGINAIPTVIIFKGGQPVKKLVGLKRKEDLLEALTAAGAQ